MTKPNAKSEIYRPSARVCELSKRYMAFNPTKTPGGTHNANYMQRVLVSMRHMQRELILDYMPAMNHDDKERAISTLARIDANITQPYL